MIYLITQTMMLIPMVNLVKIEQDLEKWKRQLKKILPSPQSYGERGSSILQGTCATWSIYITIMYILFPKFRIETIHEIVAENDPGSRLLKFLYRIYNLKNNISPPKKKFR